MKKEGCVGTGFVPREAGGDEEEGMRVASAPKLLEERGAVLMRTILRSEGIWVRGVTASTGARWSRAGAKSLERPLAWKRGLGWKTRKEGCVRTEQEGWEGLGWC